MSLHAPSSLLCKPPGPRDRPDLVICLSCCDRSHQRDALSFLLIRSGPSPISPPCQATRWCPRAQATAAPSKEHGGFSPGPEDQLTSLMIKGDGSPTIGVSRIQDGRISRPIYSQGGKHKVHMPAHFSLASGADITDPSETLSSATHTASGACSSWHSGQAATSD